MDDSLSAIMVVERDKNGDVLTTWSHQISQSSNLAQIAIERTHISSPSIPQQFIFSKYQRHWIYSYTDANKELSEKLNRLTAFSICLFTTTYNPEKYGLLCKLLSNLYNQNGNPVGLLDIWLRLVRGAPIDGFNPSDFTETDAMTHTPLRDLSRILEEELVLVWNAVMMKKRIIIYSEKMGLLLKFIRALPLFAFHRHDWDILRPYVMVTQSELEDLVSAGVYIAGFTDPSIKRKSKLWDVFVDCLSERKVTVSEDVLEQFHMTPFHKDLAETFKTSETTESNKDVLKELFTKTKALLTKLESLKVEHEDGSSCITLESLQQKKMSPGLEKFLFAVATAEGISRSQ